MHGSTPISKPSNRRSRAMNALKTGVTDYATPSCTEVVITRLVDAPRRLVFSAWTDPKHLREWMLGPPGWTMPVCELEPRPGGRYRYTWRKSTGEEMTMAGDIRE